MSVAVEAQLAVWFGAADLMTDGRGLGHRAYTGNYERRYGKSLSAAGGRRMVGACHLPLISLTPSPAPRRPPADLFRAATRAEAERQDVRCVAMVMTFTNKQAGPVLTAAHLLGYMHRYGDVEIAVYDRETDDVHRLSPDRLYEIAQRHDAAYHRQVREEMLYWDEPPQYTGF